MQDSDLPVNAVAARLGKTPQHVRTLIRRGFLPGAYRHGRDWFVPVADVDAEASRKPYSRRKPSAGE